MASNAENVSIWWRHHVYTEMASILKEDKISPFHKVNKLMAIRKKAPCVASQEVFKIPINQWVWMLLLF